MAKKKYYSIKNLLKTKAQYVIPLGQRSNGKSYSAKEEVIKYCYINNRKFVYLRRWKDDIKVNSVTAYFGDTPVDKITGGQYDAIKAHGGYLYPVEYDGDGDNIKEIRGEIIGRYCSLNDAERYKSQAFEDYDFIIFEEFITDGLYLADEPRRLQQFVSTVARDRKITVIMIGNTINRVCPYFNEWSLDGVLKQKQGTIEIYHYHTEGGVVDIAVERCETIKQDATMFFGNSEKQIVAGEWEVHDFPHLQKKKEEYEMLYELKIECQKFQFCMQLLADPETGGRFLFVYPLTTGREFERIIADWYADDPQITNCFLTNRKVERIMAELFRMDKIVFSDNLTGTDFKSCCQYLNL